MAVTLIVVLMVAVAVCAICRPTNQLRQEAPPPVKKMSAAGWTAIAIFFLLWVALWLAYKLGHDDVGFWIGIGITLYIPLVFLYAIIEAISGSSRNSK